ncbi:MAG: UDP-N-acetylmuramate--L-alanine ligase [Candidatus Fermentibacteraceae bacterium]|nr:UDP-N-acetylmuramate--L-alanine ligase [Candidatus Fermentibacteraceae bacterium]
MADSVHLLGICGSGMSSLALWYASRGYSVSGCDRAPGENLSELESAGIRVFNGHSPSHVEDCDTVVYSAAVPSDHPELLEAGRRGRRILRRSEALAELANGSHLLAVAGAHGKTTTTAMTGWILQETGLDPTVMVGGRVSAWGGNFRAGSMVSVVEADEYDRAFLRLSPEAAAVTTFAIDHLECYGTPEALSMAFGVFLEMTRPGGTVIVPAGNADLAVWAARIGRTVITTGPEGEVYFRGIEGTGWEQEYTLGDLRGVLPVPGSHNLRNAETAAALAGTLGVSHEESVEALKSFPGVSRRLEKIGSLGETLLLSDYAHHPDEIRAALEAVSRITSGTVGVVFQPHLFSRTAAQAGEMGEALSIADWSLLLPIYPAREEPLPGVNSSLVSEACTRAGGDSIPCDPGELREMLSMRNADVVIFMGAGSVDSIGRGIAGVSA